MILLTSLSGGPVLNDSVTLDSNPASSLTASVWSAKEVGGSTTRTCPSRRGPLHRSPVAGSVGALLPIRQRDSVPDGALSSRRGSGTCTCWARAARKGCVCVCVELPVGTVGCEADPRPLLSFRSFSGAQRRLAKLGCARHLPLNPGDFGASRGSCGTRWTEGTPTPHLRAST